MLDFLAADVPLVKTFTLRNGEIEKSPYPMVRDFTSHSRPVANVNQLFDALQEGATNGWCLLKGRLSRPIKQESRAGLTNTADSTQVLILDLDGIVGYAAVGEVLRALQLDQYGHIIQWSASSYLPQASSPALSAHVFFWLSNPVSPQLMKSWLMQACMTHFASNISLTRSGAALHWPLDPSVMDNGKLIYIAPPVLRGFESSMGRDVGSTQGINLVAGTGTSWSVPTSFFSVHPQEVHKNKTQLLNELRKKSGYTVLRDSQFKVSNGQLYLSKPGQATLTGQKTDRGFVYLNLNGGDSWGYYHPEDNPEYIYNFKGEPIYKTEELLPEYWASLKKIDPQRPQSKVRYFVCRDFRTDRFYNGIYYSDDDRLDLARAQNEARLRGFLKQHGQPVPDFIPDFDIVYDPHGKKKYDETNRRINLYVEGPLYSLAKRVVKDIPPTVALVIDSAVGRDNREHFLNWLGHVVQFREKVGTAWVLHGNEGTGKGVLFHHVVTPLLGESNVASITMRALDSPYNGFMEHALAVFVDEVQIPALRGSLGISANLRNFITEGVVSVRKMYTEPYNARSYANFIFASNMPDPIVVPPTDRRFHVGTFQEKKLSFGEAQLQALKAEVEDFFHYLMGLKIDRKLSRTILESEDRERLMKLSMTAADTMAAAINRGDLEDLVDNLPQVPVYPAETDYCRLVKDLLQQPDGVSILTRDELLTIFRYRVGDVPESPNKFTSFLKHHRIHTERVRRGERLFYGIKVQWQQSSEWKTQALQSLNAAPTNNVTAHPTIVRAKVKTAP